MKKDKKNNSIYERGFTLIEIIVVIVILGILSATLVTKVFSNSEKVRVDMTKANIEQIKGYIVEFNLRYNKTPRSMQDLISCTDITGSGCVPIILNKKEILDSWGTEMRLEARGGRRYAIISLGADGEAGGEGIDADIVVEGP